MTIIFSWQTKGTRDATVGPMAGWEMALLIRYPGPDPCNHFADKPLNSQSYGFSSSGVSMWGLDHKEGWALKNGCFWIVVLEKTLESPLGCEEIKRVNPRRNQPWVFIGRIIAEAEALIFWPPSAKNWLMKKTLLMLGKIEGLRRREWQRVRCLDSITKSMDMNMNKLQDVVEDRLIRPILEKGLSQ